MDFQLEPARLLGLMSALNSTAPSSLTSASRWTRDGFLTCLWEAV
jgi:hypothetical protein